MTGEATVSKSVWKPLRHPAFRILMLGNVAILLGGWGQDIAVAWLMTSLAPEPMMVALLQTAIYLPFVVLSLPAGALADIFNRRTVLICAQIWMFFGVIILGLLTVSGAMTAWMLLVLLFLTGLGSAMYSPAWNALAPELVPREELESAIALGSASFNFCRGIGSAFGGFVVGTAGPGTAILINAATMIASLLTLIWWKPAPAESYQPAERVVGAMKAGMRYVRHSAALRAVIIKTIVVVACASAVWSFLPLMAKQQYGLDATQYGLVLSLFGIGNLLGAMLLPFVRKHLTMDLLYMVSALIFAAAMCALPFIHGFILACVTMFFAGLVWIMVTAALNAGVLTSVPAWVRARAIAVFLLTFQGCLAGGSLFWGTFASYTSMPMALLTASALLVIGTICSAPFKVISSETNDLRSARSTPEPNIIKDPHPDHGPVLVTVEYMIDPERMPDFRKTMAALEVLRRRNGAYQWYLFGDLAKAGRYVETFFVENWGEYRRHMQRGTVDDNNAEKLANEFHLGEGPPPISHMLAERRKN
jgi:MFS family permease